MTTGEKIRQRREELGMTQKELADKLGYRSKTSILKLEQDQGGIKQSKIIQIAEVLGMRPIDLIDKPDNFEARAISYQTYLDSSPAMYALNELVKKNADNSAYIDHLLEYATALDLLYATQAKDPSTSKKRKKKG